MRLDVCGITVWWGAAAAMAIVLGSGACGGDGTTTSRTGSVTFWKDVAPIYNDKCVRCHQEGGIAPFGLDSYAEAKQFATAELAQINAGTMPPYFMVHDGSCGSFHDETTLTTVEKATISAWVNGDRAEGTPGVLSRPPVPSLRDGTLISTPTFAPVAVGDQLAPYDEYRCFLVDAPVTAESFLTGYEVVPGDSTIVHHVIAFLIDPAALGAGQKTNASIVQALDAASPDRLGWPCFGAAGQGVNVNGVPVTWAPGQGVVEYPPGMGVPVRPTDKFVMQVHYNLADVGGGAGAGAAGKTDSTSVRLRLASSVSRRLAFALSDPFLDTIGNATPDSLPPGQLNTAYTWRLSGAELGISGASGAELVAVMPHMHGRGVRQTLKLASSCAARLENWDFHWQQFYFYKTYPRIMPSTEIQLTCEYNTLADQEPVLPGWGTRNEMCLAVMMLAL